MITAEFIHDVAEYVKDRVAKVVLNGSYEITEFEQKEVTDNQLSLNYIIPVSEISHLTLVEVQDSSGNVISTNNVDVPISADTMFLQSIEVKEVV